MERNNGWFCCFQSLGRRYKLLGATQSCVYCAPSFPQKFWTAKKKLDRCFLTPLIFSKTKSGRLNFKEKKGGISYD